MDSSRPSGLCNRCPARNRSAFKDVEPCDVLQWTSRSYSAGSYLFQQGQSADGFYCIQKGRAKIIREIGNQVSKIIRISGPGDLEGFEGNSGDSLHHYSCTAQALEPVEACFVPRETLEKISVVSP